MGGGELGVPPITVVNVFLSCLRRPTCASGTFIGCTRPHAFHRHRGRLLLLSLAGWSATEGEVRLMGRVRSDMHVKWLNLC